MWSKVRLADHLRLMKDNQRILDQTAAQDQTLRRQRSAFREAMAAKMNVQPTSNVPEPPADDMGDINIDSPTHHHHYAARAAAAAPSLAARLAPWLLGPAIGGSLVGLGAYLSRSPVTPTAPHDDLRWRLVIPDEPQGVKP